jgi:catechol 2,3-dioxygenase-like lactoylglutathione lyase family enzyme
MKSRLNHIALVAADPERSARLFEKLLNAEVVCPAGGHGFPEVSAHFPGVTIVFAHGASVAAEPSGAHIAFSVTALELQACRTCLAQLGLRFEEPRHGPKDRALYFMDYDNNLFELSVVEVADDGDA